MSETGALLVRQTERIADLERELTAAQKDAERYQLIRAGINLMKYSRDGVSIGDRLAAEYLDAAIDREIAKQKGEPLVYLATDPDYTDDAIRGRWIVARMVHQQCGPNVGWTLDELLTGDDPESAIDAAIAAEKQLPPA